MTVDVLVAGCGPVGAVLASRLVQRGLSVVVVDPSTDVHPLPRAVAADDEVQELLERTCPGALDGAVQDVPVRFLGADGSLVGELRFPRGVGGRPGLVLFDQPSLERRLRAGLSSADLRLGVGLAGVAQDFAGVSARLDDGSLVRARWLVGCDGAGSAVRQLAGIGWRGRDLRRWLVRDVTGEVPSTGFTYSCDPAGPSVDMPLPGGHRWEWLLPDAPAMGHDLLGDGVLLHRKTGAEGHTGADPLVAGRSPAPWPVSGQARGQARGQAASTGGGLPSRTGALRQRAAHPWQPPAPPPGTTVLREVVYRYGARRADRWRRGRVLLAGDAAHTMPPFAGQGLGAGVRDAWALAALISRDEVERYEPLRAPHVAAMTRLSLFLGAVLETRSPAAAAARDRLLRSAFATPLLGSWLGRGAPRSTTSGVLRL